MAKQAKKPASGGARLMAAGRKPMLLGFTPEEHARIKRAAVIERRPMAQLAAYYVLAAVEKILKKAAD